MMIYSKISMLWTKAAQRYMKAWAFFLLLSCGHVIEVKVLKQVRNHFVQTEGCKRQLIQVLRKAAEEIRIYQGK